MINENFVILGALISFLGGLSYLVSTVKGKTKPNRVTWFFWTLAPFVVLGGQVSQGVWAASLITFMAGFNPMLIFIASFWNKNSVWKLQKFDYLCGALALLGIILWQITKIGDMAILFGILADFIAAIPTFIKTYKFPQTENYKIYLAGIINAVITLLTIKVWELKNFAFAVNVLVICSLLCFLILRRRFIKPVTKKGSAI